LSLCYTTALLGRIPAANAAYLCVYFIKASMY
jgi:hypothetical protein